MFMKISAEGIKPAMRIPLTASNWLGVETKAAKENMDKYPKLSEQYQTMISNMIDAFNAMGAVVILDLQWCDDDAEQTNLPLKQKPGTGGAIEFWRDVSARFKGNDHVFYELYNEPHDNDADTFIYGNDTYAGALDMMAAIRDNTSE